MSATRIDPNELTPSNPDGAATSLPTFYTDLIAAINEHADELDASAVGQVVSVTSYGADTTGATDSRAAILLAWAAAKAAGHDLYFPPGTYKLSKYLDLADGVGVTIYGNAATIVVPSDDTSIPTDSVATTSPLAQSGFFLRYCRNVEVRDLTFQGADNPAFDTANFGSSIHATHCVGLRVVGCYGRNGSALFSQDSLASTAGTGDSISISGSTAMLTDAGALFRSGHVGGRITISGATNEANNGVFVVTGCVSATQLQYANANAVAETSSLTWSVDDNDRATRVESCRSDGCRGPMSICSDSVIANCHFEIPDTKDGVGHADSYAISGTTVTLYDASGPFTASMVGKYIKTTGSTSAANDGTFKIASVVSVFKVTYTNAAGVTELIPSTASWWVMGGERQGVGAGSGGLSKSSNTMTLAASAPVFSASDVNRILRIKGATTAGNNSSFVITAVLSSTQCQYTNSGGATEAYSGPFSIDSWDEVGGAGVGRGSTHAIYLFAGRSNVKVLGCTFRGVRTTCVKVSGSAVPIREIEVAHCTAEECGSFVIYGADDRQEHTGLNVHHNTLIDVGNGREGWCQATVIEMMGSRNNQVCNNTIHFTHDAIASVDGRSGGVGGFQGIQALRYVPGVSQPCEDVLISGNTITADPAMTRAANVMATAIKLTHVGINATYRTGGTLTINGTTMTLTDGSAEFPQDLVGQSITIVNAPDAGNNGTFTITAVGNGSSTNQTTLQYTNAAGVGGGVSAGTYRIPPVRGAGSALISDNHILHCCTTGISSTSCVGIEVIENTFSGLLTNVVTSGDCAPRAALNRELGANTQNAMLRFGSGTSWPIAHDNTITNNAIGGASSHDWGVGVDNGTIVDYPLLGKTVRLQPTNAQEEIVLSYGSLHVDGDTITVSGVTYTYKATAPAGNQFNSFAGLVALVAAQAGLTCADYGSTMTAGGILTPVTTQHLRIRKTAQSTSDGSLTVASSTLNPTALVVLRNHNGSNLQCDSRGSGSAGPVPDKIVAWSPLARWSGIVTVAPDNTDARTVLQVNGPALALKNANNAGACELINVGDCTGKAPEFRAVFH